MPPPVLRALLVSDTPFFLSTVFAPFPFLALDHVRPVEFRPSDVYDLYIFDGWLPPELPPGNWLIFNPPAGSTLLPVSGEMLEPPLDYVAQDHRLMQFVDIRDLRVSRAQRMELPAWADELLGSNRGPLLFSGTIDGRRMVVFSFSLLQSNLPLRTAFPVLMGNIYPVAQSLPHSRDGFSPAAPGHNRIGTASACRPLDRRKAGRRTCLICG